MLSSLPLAARRGESVLSLSPRYQLAIGMAGDAAECSWLLLGLACCSLFRRSCTLEVYCVLGNGEEMGLWRRSNFGRGSSGGNSFVFFFFSFSSGLAVRVASSVCAGE